MTNIYDVAAYILEKLGPMSTMKLQKLCYYSKAWHLVWDEETLFPEKIQAWANGPVAPALYRQHRGLFNIDRGLMQAGDSSKLTGPQRDTIDAVLRDYGDLSGRQLSYLTHSEAPWREARGGIPDTASSEAVITEAAMADYFGAVDASDASVEVSSMNWAPGGS